MTDPGPPQTPAEWLIDEFEAACFGRRTLPGQPRSVVTQPMYQLKNAMDAGHPMRVTQRDYYPAERWWL